MPQSTKPQPKTPKKPKNRNDTQYLLSDPAMKRHLLRAIDAVKQGKLIQRDLIEID